MYAIRATFRSVSDYYGSTNLRGDGTVESRKPLTFNSRDAAEAMAARLRKDFPDTTYSVVSAKDAR